jgi:hypothetical protein
MFQLVEANSTELSTSQYIADYEAEMKAIDDSHIAVYRGLGDDTEGFVAEPRGSMGSFLQRLSVGASSKSLTTTAAAVDRQSLLTDDDEATGDAASDAEEQNTRC